MDIKRRTFLKCAAAAAGGSLLGSAGAADVLAGQVSSSAAYVPDSKVIRGVCTVNCTSRCNLAAHVKDGSIESVTPGVLPGRPDYSNCCLRGMSLPWKVQSENRVKYPMLRTGKRGEGKFRRISWDEAYDIIASKLEETKKKRGNMRSAGFFSMTGNLAKFSWEANFRFANTIEATKFTSEGIMSDHGASMGMQLVYGQIRGAHDTRDYMNSKMLIVWGRNVADTHTSEIRYMLDARQNGTKIVVIDPRMSSTAAIADQWIGINPGTDTALALGMMNIIIENGLHDAGWLTDYSCGPLLVRTDDGRYMKAGDKFMVIDSSGKAVPDGKKVKKSLSGAVEVNGVKCVTSFDLLAESLKKYTPEWTSEVTGISSDTIERLAFEYASEGPCGIRMGQGMQRVFNSHSPFRTVATLAAVCGYIGVKGGGASHAGGTATNKPIPGVNVPLYNAADWNNTGGKTANELKGIRIYEMAEKGEPYPLDFLWIACSNFVNQSPDMNRLINDVLPKIPFIVQADPYWTVTARYADLVLPANTMWENWDLIDKSPWIMLMQPAVKKIGESKSDVEIFSGLARRMGIEKYWSKPDEEWVRNYVTSEHPALKGLEWKSFVKEGIFARKDGIFEPVNAFADKKFKTQTGKFEFYSERLVPVGHQLPVYTSPCEDPKGPMGKKYPLVFIQYHDRVNVHSQHMRIPALRTVASEPWAEINPEDAAERGIKTGDYVKVFNGRGSCTVKAVVTPGIVKGAVAIPQGWEPQDFKAGSHQELTHLTLNKVEDLISETNFAAYDNLVEVTKA